MVAVAPTLDQTLQGELMHMHKQSFSEIHPSMTKTMKFSCKLKTLPTFIQRDTADAFNQQTCDQENPCEHREHKHEQVRLHYSGSHLLTSLFFPQLIKQS